MIYQSFPFVNSYCTSDVQLIWQSFACQNPSYLLKLAKVLLHQNFALYSIHQIAMHLWLLLIKHKFLLLYFLGQGLLRTIKGDKILQ